MPTTDDQLNDQPEDPFEKLVLDEEFVRAAEHKEHSARSRMLAARWKHTPPKDTAFRAPVTPTRRRRLRRLVAGRWQAPLFVLLAAGLVAVAMNPKAVHDWALSKAPGTGSVSGNPFAGAGDTPTPSTAPNETTTPTAAPPTEFDPQTPTLEHPFAGSPADSWPSGANAITVPAARAVGVYSAATVASYLQHAKDFLVDSNLSPAVVGGGYPTAALALIDPDESKLLTSLRHELAHPSASGDGTELFSRFNPDQAIPIGDVVKIQGELSYRSDGSGGLAIHADVTFVYALKPGPHPTPWLTGTSAAPSANAGQVSLEQATPVADDLDVARSIIRRIVDFQVADAHAYEHTPGKLWITQWNPDIGNSACGVSNGFINPEFPESMGADTASPSGPATDPYDRSKVPDDKQQGCGTLSRT
ncbi:SCO2583/SCO2584 N-terminal domain-containing protein [Streptacidiphilus rugosus]|uniref:SCO2583/SCO2584 N-terminal domain-containing protein n=1 Tax=Streptacidiphilus rugosus TaxID=405783 RepID=UPI00055FF980|nr:hypothetical protein [Streptacidiphilus rugosus]